MPNPLNRYPGGLLSMLDSKAQGQTPAELATVASAIIDLQPFLLHSKRGFASATSGTVNTVGFHGSTANQIPSDELWYVWRVGVGITGNPGVVPAASAVRFRPYINMGALGPIAIGDVYQSFTAGEAVYVVAEINDWLPPRTLFGAVVQSGTFGAAWTFTIHVDRAPFSL